MLHPPLVLVVQIHLFLSHDLSHIYVGIISVSFWGHFPDIGMILMTGKGICNVFDLQTERPGCRANKFNINPRKSKV